MFVIKWNKKMWKITDAINKNKNKQILEFKSRKQLNKWYEKEFSRKIETK